MHTKEKIEFISNWIKDYAHSNNVDALVIGIQEALTLLLQVRCQQKQA